MPAAASHADASDDHLGALKRGTMLFEYRIDAVLGHGGFGITYLAEDTLLNEPVAIKEFFPSHTAVRTGDQSARARSKREAQAFREGVESFLSEARIIARFRHPSIMQVRRFFEAHGTGYMVLEFVQGQSLETALDPGRMPEALVRTILAGILDGLATLHDRAILHRDLKPRNVILRQDGSPVLIDFGAARDFGARHSATITQIVSPNYSSPEQYGVGQQQGPWSDFYSLGAILYRAVTGRVPVDSLRRLRSDPLEPASEVAATYYSPALLALIDKLLAIDAEQRPASVADIQRLLEDRVGAAHAPTRGSTSDPGSAAGKARPSQVVRRAGLGRSRLGLPIVVVAAAMLVLGGAGTWMLHGSASSPFHPAPPARPAGDAGQVSTATPAAPSVAPKSQPAPATASEPRRPDHLDPGTSFRDCSHCPAMTVVPAGTFQMGSNERSAEQPIHTVRIAAPLAIGQREVTVGEWAACVAAGGCSFRPEERGPGHDDDPVTDLSWLDTQSYVAWLTRTSGHLYRLPSEAEWEYAARGGTSSTYWWGAAAGEDHANCAGCGPKSRDTVMAGASFPPNPFGLYDTAGNASEWVDDCWTDTYAGAPSDGQAVTVPNCTQHVLRGGSFNNDPTYARPSSRLKYGTAVRYYANGFRVASDVSQP